MTHDPDYYYRLGVLDTLGCDGLGPRESLEGVLLAAGEEGLHIAYLAGRLMAYYLIEGDCEIEV